MTIISRVNDDYLYRSPDGREAWIMFNGAPDTGLAFVVTDVHNQGQPYNAVGFDASTLRWIADRLDEATQATSS